MRKNEFFYFLKVFIGLVDKLLFGKCLCVVGLSGYCYYVIGFFYYLVYCK